MKKIIKRWLGLQTTIEWRHTESDFKRLSKAPMKAHPTDAAYDLVAASMRQVDPDRQVFEMGTGIAFNIPRGWMGLVFPRSSIYKSDFRLANGVGVIDHGYQKEIKFMFDLRTDLIKTGSIEHNMYKVGDRIGQILFLPCNLYDLEQVHKFTALGSRDGFGSTGK